MAFDLGSVIAHIKADVTDFKKGISTASDTLNNFGKNIRNQGAVLTAAVTTPLVGLGIAAVKSAADMEQLEVSFSTMLGSAEKAKTLLGQLTEFAATTPFQLTEVQNSAKSLLAYGVAAGDVQKTLKAIGDVAAGTGTPLGEMADMFGKMKSSGVVFTEDLNQLTGRGIPILDFLAKKYKTNVLGIREMASQGKLSFKDIEQGLTSMSSEGGLFFDLMDKQSKTTAGQFSNMQDSISQLSREIGEVLIPFATQLINKTMQLVNWFRGLDDNQKKLVLGVLAFVAAIGPLMIILGSFIMLLGLIVSPIGLIVTAIALVIAAVVGLYLAWTNNWFGIRDTVNGVIESIKNFFVGLWTSITTTFTNIQLAASNFVLMIGQFFTNLWLTYVQPPITLIIGILQFFASIFTWLYTNIIEPISLLINAIIARVFYEIWSIISTVLGWIWGKFQEIFGLLWGYVEPYFNKFLKFVTDTWNAMKQSTIDNWNLIKNSILKPLTEAKEKTETTTSGMFTWIQDKWNGIVSFFNGIKDRVVSAIVGPFEEAKRKIEEIAQKIRDAAEKINPFHKESPSLVENVQKGLGIIKDQYSALSGSFGMPTVAHMGGQPAMAGAGVSGGIVINLDGANISSPQVASQYAELIGDQIMKRLKMNIKF